jgi:hypothetical protein
MAMAEEIVETFNEWKARMIRANPEKEIQYVPLALLSYPPIPVYRAYVDGVMVDEWVGQSEQLFD